MCPCHIGAQLCESAPVTHRLAIILGLMLIAAVVIDGILFGTEHFIFLGKKLFELIEWMAFWR